MFVTVVWVFTMADEQKYLQYKYGGHFSLLVGYNIQPTSSSTNQNAALMIDNYSSYFLLIQITFVSSYFPPYFGATVGY